MYEAFYGLSSKPFQLNDESDFMFSGKQARRAKAYLEYGVSRNEGFIVVTGESDSGKEALLRSLIEGLRGGNVVTGHLSVATQLGAKDTLRLVGAAFGFGLKGVPNSELLITLEAFLINQIAKGKRCLLVIDEAQNLTPEACEELRTLSSYQFGNQALLQIFLSGLPEFREILQRPEMEQFRQRVAATCHIGPLGREETEQYILHLLKRSGSTGKPTFSAGAFEAVYRASGGVPRRINTVCDRLMLLGFLANKFEFNADDVHEVFREVVLEVEAPLAQAPTSAPTSAPSGAAPLKQHSIFLSYRRQDCSGQAGRLHDRLASHFGREQIFMDVDNIEPGDDFVEVIQRSVQACQVLLALIGPQWVSLKSRQGEYRLHDPNDFVRLEIEFAFRLRIPVIPILVGGATMPNKNDLPEALYPLLRRQAAELSDKRFHSDTERLMAAIQRKHGLGRGPGSA